ncbi:hypothetical protein LSCM1_01781 [Leishmania martiniquensis]|uniref:LicD/FKTN/FKRP nucleotidyltransferase domain-containing protein n=1 Tax=Leishmania martiniquensis TaxID=1580590 RepID=A0A836GMP2_9TRYP|nr:hypothetical protein LSCM1_01781 [Leishmania martiniquensis]
MQRHSRAWKRAAVAAFQPHLHLEDCRICAAAESAHKYAEDGCTGILRSTNVPGNGIAAETFPSPLARAPSCEGVFPDVSGAPPSVFELRRGALLEWLQHFSVQGRKGGRGDEEAFMPVKRSSKISGSDDFDAVYEAYLRCKDVTAQEALFSRLVDCLDAQCSAPVRPVALPTPTPAAMAPSSAPSDDEECGGVRIPQFLWVPRVGAALTSTEEKATDFRVGGETDTPRAANDFETYVRRRFADSAALITRQLAFQEALLAIQEVLMSQRIRFFLACGTALGARRDGCFIPYDEDIDIGILYTDMAAPVTDGDDSPVPDLSLPSATPADLSRVQMRVYCLLQALASTCVFVVFDICGAVERGLELRVLHLATGARIDINLYYPPLCATFCGLHGDASDDALVREKGEFVWAASFYEAANARKHRMYRYRHTPFATDLEELPFCAKKASVGSGFLVPPERYLIENYGEDWRTPKQYSYTEGLAGEFKNVVPE